MKRRAKRVMIFILIRALNVEFDYNLFPNYSPIYIKRKCLRREMVIALVLSVSQLIKKLKRKITTPLFFSSLSDSSHSHHIVVQSRSQRQSRNGDEKRKTNKLVIT
mmetsp:Transcript_10493/g.11420  ORF Transcript_10493/g.11420 Transcript_10493/m.11420 type:complete len:106 (-) Transcript_10493:310-627(-)